MAVASILLVVGMVYFVSGRSGGPTSLEDGKLSVVASFYPLAEFSRKIGGDLVSVETITPPGVEPHDFEPSPSQLISAQKARLFLYNGAGLDPWAQRMSGDLRGHGAKVISMRRYVDPIHSGKGVDPHYWLDPVSAIRQAGAISAALQQIDPDNKAAYQGNAAGYIGELEELATDYKTGLSDCRTRTIVTTHEAFAYLARRYDLEVIAIAGVSPEQEPSADKLAVISRTVKERKIEYIFAETLSTSKFADTVARESGAKTLVFNPIEGLTEKEISKGKNYISIMRENLSKLRLALECK